MARSKLGAPTVLTVCVCMAILAICVIAWFGYRKERFYARADGPLDPGVRVRDTGSGRSKCYSCEQ